MKYTLNQIKKVFSDFAADHQQIHTFGFGDISELNTSGTTNYPVLWAMPEPSVINKSTVNLRFRLYFMDLVHKGNHLQRDEVWSDQLSIATDLIAHLSDLDKSDSFDDNFDFDPNNISIEPFLDEFDDEVAGWNMGIDIPVLNDRNKCAIPSTNNSSSVGGGGSDDGDITFNVYVDGVLDQVITVHSGDTININL